MVQEIHAAASKDVTIRAATGGGSIPPLDQRGNAKLNVIEATYPEYKKRGGTRAPDLASRGFKIPPVKGARGENAERLK